MAASNDNVSLPSAGKHGEDVTIDQYVWEKAHFTALVILCTFKIDELMKRVATLDENKHEDNSIAQKTLGSLIAAVFKDSILGKSVQCVKDSKGFINSVNDLRNKVAHWNPKLQEGLGSVLDCESYDGRTDNEAQKKQEVRKEEVQEMETQKAKFLSDYKQAVEGLIPLLVILSHDYELESRVLNKLWEIFEARQNKQKKEEEEKNTALEGLNDQQAAQIKLYELITDKTYKHSLQHALEEIKKVTPTQPNKELKQQKVIMDIVADEITRSGLRSDSDGYAYLRKILAEIIEKGSKSIGFCKDKDTKCMSESQSASATERECMAVHNIKDYSVILSEYQRMLAELEKSEEQRVAAAEVLEYMRYEYDVLKHGYRYLALSYDADVRRLEETEKAQKNEIRRLEMLNCIPKLCLKKLLQRGGQYDEGNLQEWMRTTFNPELLGTAGIEELITMLKNEPYEDVLGPTEIGNPGRKELHDWLQEMLVDNRCISYAKSQQSYESWLALNRRSTLDQV